MIAVFGAMEEEIAGLLINMRIKEIVLDEENRERIYKGTILGKEAVIARTNVGMENAGDIVRIVLYRYKPTMFLSVGWAGGIRDEIKRGDMVIGVNIHSEHSPQVKTDLALYLRAVNVLERERIPYHVGGSLTVPRALLLPEEKKKVGEIWPVSMVEMESHKIASMALRERIPCLVARVISDACKEEAGTGPARVSVSKVLDKFLLSFIEEI